MCFFYISGNSQQKRKLHATHAIFIFNCIWKHVQLFEHSQGILIIRISVFTFKINRFRPN